MRRQDLTKIVKVAGVILAMSVLTCAKGGKGKKVSGEEALTLGVSVSGEITSQLTDVLSEDPQINEVINGFPPEFVMPSGSKATEKLKSTEGMVRAKLTWSEVQGPETGPDSTDGWYYWEYSWGSNVYRFWIKSKPEHNYTEGWPSDVDEMWIAWTGEAGYAAGYKWLTYYKVIDANHIEGNYRFEINPPAPYYAGSWWSGDFDYTYYSASEEGTGSSEYSWGFSYSAHWVSGDNTRDFYGNWQGDYTYSWNNGTYKWESKWRYYMGNGTTDDPGFTERPDWTEDTTPAGDEWAGDWSGAEKAGLIVWSESTYSTEYSDGLYTSEWCYKNWYYNGSHYEYCKAPEVLIKWKEGCFKGLEVVEGNYENTDLPSEPTYKWVIEANRTVIASPVKYGRTPSNAKTIKSSSSLSKDTEYTLIFTRQDNSIEKVSFKGGALTVDAELSGDECAPPVAKVEISPSPAEVEKGKTIELTANPKDAEGNIISDVEIRWKSTNPEIAGVNSYGVVTGIKEGETIITANAEGVWGSVQVTVTPPPPTPGNFGSDIQVNDTSYDMTPELSGNPLINSASSFFSIWKRRTSSTNPWSMEIFFDKPDIQSTDKKVHTVTLEDTPYYPIFIDMDSNGVIYVMWTEWVGAQSQGRIYLAKSTDGGVNFTTSIPISNAILELMALDDQNHIFIVYSNSQGSNHYFSASNDGGNTFGSSLSLPQASYYNGDMVAGGNNAYITYQDNGIKFLKVSGGSAGTPVAVNDVDWPFDPRIAIGNNGSSVHIVWTTEGNSGVYYSKSTDSGSSFGSRITITAGSYTFAPDIDVDANNTVHITYALRDTANKTGDVYYTKSSDGQNFSNPVKVNDNPAYSSTIARISSRGNKVGILWNDNNNVFFDYMR